MKCIAIFADGTWNSPEHGTPTNILRMARAVQPNANGTVQVAFYDWGVGTDRKQVSGCVSGIGLNKNIRDCYRFLIHNYEQGDKLYFFGFSRGAYTVRSLGGLIRNCGILRREHADQVDEAFALYRRKDDPAKPAGDDSKRFRATYAVEDRTTIRFLGVFDTVGSYGIPMAKGSWANKKYEFHDLQLSSIIQDARHAVSIDETRGPFEPTLCEVKPAETTLKQIWFAGVHSDVGGGYPKHGLSDCACKWMVLEADNCGITFEPHLLAGLQEAPSAVQHNERRFSFKLLKTLYRLIPPHRRAIKGKVHVSVQQRYTANAHGYQNDKNNALNRHFAAMGGVDWNAIGVAENIAPTP